MSFIPCYAKAKHPEHLSEKKDFLRTYEKESDGFLSALSSVKWYLSRPLRVDSETLNQVLIDHQEMYGMNLREIIEKKIREHLPVPAEEPLPSYMLKEKNTTIAVIDNMMFEILRIRISLQSKILDEVVKRFL